MRVSIASSITLERVLARAVRSCGSWNCVVEEWLQAFHYCGYAFFMVVAFAQWKFVVEEVLQVFHYSGFVSQCSTCNSNSLIWRQWVAQVAVRILSEWQ